MTDKENVDILETSYHQHLKKIEELKSENKRLSAALSAYENGIKIEDADKEKSYQYCAGSKWLTVSWENDHALGYEMFAWCVFDDDYECYGIVEPEIVFPLPPSNKGEEDV